MRYKLLTIEKEMKGDVIMDNQYNYYMPENDNEHTIYEETVVEEPKVKKKRKLPKWLKVVGGGVLFGVVASGVFLGCSAAGYHIFGLGSQQSIASTSTADVSSTKVSQTSSTITSDVSAVVENVMPSIVSITNMSVQEVQDFFGGIQQQQSESCGSGIIIEQTDSELLILTNNHVVEGCETLTVSFADDSSVEAQVKGTDSDRDLAVVAVKLSDISSDTMSAIKTATLGDSDALTVGEPVIAIGNALGYGQSVTTGVVSALNRTMDDFDGTYIQTDAAINPGNSGGALLNAKGEVIGINSAKIASDEVEGMGYAIPISDVTDIVNDLMNQTTRSKVASGKQGYIGIKGMDVSEEAAEAYGIPEGVYVSEVTKGSGAEEAGLQKGDIIVKFDGSTISEMSELQDKLQYYAVGEKVTVTVQRPDGNEYVEKEVDVTLTKQSN
jgi:serine protease Do